LEKQPISFIVVIGGIAKGLERLDEPTHRGAPG
jgi:hypothetical protein